MIFIGNLYIVSNAKNLISRPLKSTFFQADNENNMSCKSRRKIKDEIIDSIPFS
jgi:hypothetical protein